MKKLLIPVCSAMVFSSLAMAAKAPTFSKDVAPILYNRCLECHRPGEAGPMAFRTYQETRPWAKAIKQAVMTHNMPPWYADTTIDHFKNDRHLSDQEVATITKWVDAGAPEGKSSELPKLPVYTEGWAIGKPDLVLSLPTEFKIPANGVVPYKYFTIDPGFTEDTWIQAAEVRPTQRAQVHHILVFAQDGKKRNPRGGEQFADMVIGYAPGVPSLTWDADTAFLVKAGSTLLLQVHYTTNGNGSDRQIGGRAEDPQGQTEVSRHLRVGHAVPPGHSAGRAELHGQGVVHVPRRYHRAGSDAAHALARESVQVRADLSGRPQRSAAGCAALRFQLAAGLCARRAAERSRRIAHGRDRVVRQFAEQQVQSRSQRRPCTGAIRRSRR